MGIPISDAATLSRTLESSQGARRSVPISLALSGADTSYYELRLAMRLAITESDSIVFQLAYKDPSTGNLLSGAAPVTIGDSGLNGYASYRIEEVKSLPQVAWEMNTSERKLRDNYLELVSAKKLAQSKQIMPSNPLPKVPRYYRLDP